MCITEHFLGCSRLQYRSFTPPLKILWKQRAMSVLPIAVTNKVTAVAEAESCLYVGITHKTQTTEFIND